MSERNQEPGMDFETEEKMSRTEQILREAALEEARLEQGSADALEEVSPSELSRAEELASEAAEKTSAKRETAKKENPNAAKKRKKRRKKKKKNKTKAAVGVIIGCLVVLAALLAFAYFVVKPDFLMKDPDPVEINLDAYVSYKFLGYDTVGVAEVGFDEERFISDHKDDLQWRKTAKKNAIGYSEDLTAAEWAADYLYGYAEEETTDLSNGDVLHYKWYMTEDVMTYLSYCTNGVFTYNNREITVSGLEEAQLVDIFENVSLSYEGISGEATATLNVPEDEWFGDLITLQAEPLANLSNGDQVRVYFEWTDSDREAFIEKYGKEPTATESYITVKGLPYYIEEYAEIPTKTLESMTSYIAEALASDLEAGLPEGVTVQSIESVGSIYQAANGYQYSHNILDNVMLVTLSMNATEESEGTTLAYYYYTQYTDFFRETNGDITFFEKTVDNYTSPQGTFDMDYDDPDDGVTYTITLRGFTSLDDLKAEVLDTANYKTVKNLP